MNIVIASLIDWAGAGYRLAEAINRHTDHTAVQIVNREHRLEFPFMYRAENYNMSAIKKAMDGADWVIWGASNQGYRPLGLEWPDKVKKAVWHQGSAYRRDYKRLNKGHGSLDLVFAHRGLVGLGEDIHELPVPFNVKDYDIPVRDTDKMVIGHAFVDRKDTGGSINGTGLFYNAVKILGRRYDFGVEEITGMFYREALERKKKCHIFFDRILQIDIPDGSQADYGLSLVEGATFGSALLGGSPWDDVPRIKVRNEEDLVYGIGRYLETPHMAEHDGLVARGWAEKVHDYSVVGPYFTKILEEFS